MNLLHMKILDVVSFLLIPFIAVIMLTSSVFIQMVMAYVMVGSVLSVCLIEIKDKPQYGKVLHERSRKGCKRCFLAFVVVEMILLLWVFLSTYLGASLEMSMLLFTILNTVYFIYLIRNNIKVKFYAEGILYKGIFYTKEELKEAYIVKNYRDEYECYLQNRKAKMILDADELKIVNDLIT